MLCYKKRLDGACWHANYDHCVDGSLNMRLGLCCARACVAGSSSSIVRFVLRSQPSLALSRHESETRRSEVEGCLVSRPYLPYLDEWID